MTLRHAGQVLVDLAALVQASDVQASDRLPDAQAAATGATVSDGQRFGKNRLSQPDSALVSLDGYRAGLTVIAGVEIFRALAFVPDPHLDL